MNLKLNKKYYLRTRHRSDSNPWPNAFMAGDRPHSHSTASLMSTVLLWLSLVVAQLLAAACRSVLPPVLSAAGKSRESPKMHCAYTTLAQKLLARSLPFFLHRVDLFNTRKTSRLAFLSGLGCVRAIDRGTPYRNRDSQPNRCGMPKMAEIEQKKSDFLFIFVFK